MARRFRSSFKGSSKRVTEWAGQTPRTTLVAVAGSSAVLLTVFLPGDNGVTVVRTRGVFGWKTDQIAANEDQMGAVGIGLVSAQAVSVGITALPHPSTDSGWDGWLWHSYFVSSFSFITGVGFEPNMLHLLEIDSKAMRKVSNEMRLVTVVENDNTDGISVYSASRILTKPF